jgi:hypothetical protein
MNPKEIHGVVEDEEGRRPFMLRISEPRRTDAGDYFCSVDLAAVAAVGEGVRIYGVDSEQAQRLSLDFVRKMLAGKKLFDKNGGTLKI